MSGAPNVAPPTPKRSLLGVIVDDFSSWFRSGEKFVEDEAIALWGTFKGVLQNLLPEQWQIFLDVVNRAMKDEGAGKSVDETIADVLTLAAAEELHWISELGSEFIAAGIVLVKGPANPPPALPTS